MQSILIKKNKMKKNITLKNFNLSAQTQGSINN